MMSLSMTPFVIDPDRSDEPGLVETTVNALAPRERVRGPVVANPFGDQATPTRIDRFELIRELGTGGMGSVYAAHDPRLDRTVALKVLARTGDGPEGNQRLLREAQAMARLRHPNVVAVHEVGTHGDHVFVAMELVDGGTAADWIRGGPRPWRQVLDLLIPVGRGLAAAHAVGLVHRDFKPANVLLGVDGRPLVSDFGLARAGAEPGDLRPLDSAEVTAEIGRSLVAAQLTRTGVLLGTPAYMAPEQFRGAVATVRSDIFAFCVVVWEAIFGRRPFDGDSLVELVGAIEAGRLAPTPRGISVPADLRRQLVRGLAVNPADRHASMTELLHALASAGRSRTLGRGLVAAGAAFAAVSIGTTAIFLSSNPPSDPVDAASRVVTQEPESSVDALARWRQAPRPAESVVTIDRDRFAREFATLTAFADGARMMSSLRHGTKLGLVLYGLRPGTRLKELGFSNGDLLVGLDDQPLTGPDSWDAAIAAAAADGEFTLVYRRRGELFGLTLRIEDTPAPAR